MTRTLKVFGLTVVAVIALAGVAASSASAYMNFEAEKQLTAFRGEQTESLEYKLAGQTFLCTVSVYRGMFTPVAAATFETSDSAEGGKGLEYLSCTYGAEKATFTSNHCNYKFNAEKETLDVIANGTVTEENECKANGMVFLTEKSKCQVSIKPEAKNVGLAATTKPVFENGGMGAERFVEVRPSFTKIKYTATEPCPSKKGTFENGEYLRGNLHVLGYTGTKFSTRAGFFVF